MAEEEAAVGVETGIDPTKVTACSIVSFVERYRVTHLMPVTKPSAEEKLRPRSDHHTILLPFNFLESHTVSVWHGFATALLSR